jgi:hypothetical protein
MGVAGAAPPRPVDPHQPSTAATSTHPRATGPTGASACMITASQNNAQGGIMTGFNYDWRVLNGDPFRVLISA